MSTLLLPAKMTRQKLLKVFLNLPAPLLDRSVQAVIKCKSVKMRTYNMQNTLVSRVRGKYAETGDKFKRYVVVWLGLLLTVTIK